jgi:hypothetical protein
VALLARGCADWPNFWRGHGIKASRGTMAKIAIDRRGFEAPKNKTQVPKKSQIWNSNLKKLKFDRRILELLILAAWNLELVV